MSETDRIKYKTVMNSQKIIAETRMFEGHGQGIRWAIKYNEEHSNWKEEHFDHIAMMNSIHSSNLEAEQIVDAKEILRAFSQSPGVLVQHFKRENMPTDLVEMLNNIVSFFEIRADHCIPNFQVTFSIILKKKMLAKKRLTGIILESNIEKMEQH